ncbi:MAG: SBBP repeat-containing protein [Planctomycetes bacterium]|nr:SBBP repeat-containing protein [Planctomycetota bacterium]MCH9724125.1 SBBP repeat-containing protein [Planctomycetota bacterium]MCH9778022.1 SBBP repeat-containing protein [Planctomycetota bacterium]MCH9793011.1 SBBP repeat-containing protein [Planctomycetota bacterium]
MKILFHQSRIHCFVLFLFALTGCLFFTHPTEAGENKGATNTAARSILWVQQEGGSKHDKIRGMAVDREGNCYVTGEFTETAQFADKTVTSRGSMDFVLAKYNPQGKLLWLQTAGGTKIDRGYGVAVDQAGNSYVTGHFQSPTFQIGDKTFKNHGDYDYFIAKYDPTGKLLWAESAGGKGYDYGHGIAVTPEGECYVAGTFAGAVTIGGSQSKHKQGSSMFVARYDTDGKMLWSQMAGNGRRQSGHQIAVDHQGNCYLCGLMTGIVELAGQPMGTDTKQQDIFLAKLSPAGKFVWSANSGGQANGLSTGVAVDKSGNCYLTGMFKNEAKFGKSTLKSAGEYDIFVARINVDGTPGWAYSGGGKKIDYGLGIAVDQSGNCYVTGEFTDDVNFMGKHLTKLGGRDLFITRFSPEGKLDWLEMMGGDKSDLSYAIAVDDNNHCFISGAFSPSTQYQNHKLVSRGSNDIFLIKLSQ